MENTRNIVQLDFLGRRRNLGLTGGSLWLVASGTGFAAYSLLMVRSAEATALLVIIFLVAARLIVVGIVMLRRLFQLRNDPSQRRPPEGRQLGRQFGAIVAIEGIALTGVTLACVFNHRWALIAPLDLIIVGLHFLPLARLFDVPRYNITGALFCGIPIMTMLLIPASGRFGETFSWLVIPSVGCALAASITAWAGLREVGLFLRTSQTRI
jgi:hypothetical protein